MELCNEFRRPRAISCPRYSLAGKPRYRPSTWDQNNDYFRACFERDLDPGEEDSDLEDMIAGVKGNDYSMSTSRAADDNDDDGDGDPDQHPDGLGREDADSRKLWSAVDDNVNHDDSSSRRGNRLDESGFEQDYLDDFESTISESETNASFASSTQERRGGPQGMDDENSDGAKKEESDDEDPDVKNENEEKEEAEEERLAEQKLDPELPDEYVEEEMDAGSSEKLESKLTISKCHLKGRRVLIRADFNVPMEDGEILDKERIELALPTIQYALDKGAKSVVLMSHVGRPEGRVDLGLSLRPVAAELESLLGGRTVTFLEDCVGETVEAACADPTPGSVILLENLRFHVEEEGHGVDEDGETVWASPDDVREFRESLRKLGDVYVNDDFCTANKAHSSVVGVDLPERAAGFLLKQEVERVLNIMEQLETPHLLIVGGKDLSVKVNLIENYLDTVTDLIITGSVAFTFLKVLNDMEIGDSPFDDAIAELVPQIHQKAKSRNVNLYFPVDFVVVDPSDENALPDTVDEETGIPVGKLVVDVGEKSRQLFADVISRAETIVWSGPPGAWETDGFAEGSKAMATGMIEAIERGVPVILGDRETGDCAKKFEIDMKSVVFGEVCVDMLQGKVLPAIVALTNLAKIRADWNVRPMRTAPLANKRVGIRLDLDVSLEKDEDGTSVLTDQGILKLAAVLPTVNKALSMGARSVVIYSHRGDPKGQPDPELSMRPIASELEKLLERPVTFLEDCVGEATEAQCENPWPGSVFLLENLRFHPEEQGNSLAATPSGEKTVLAAEEDTGLEGVGRDGEGEGVDGKGEGMDGEGEGMDGENIKGEAEENPEENEEAGAATTKIVTDEEVAAFRAALSRLVDVFVNDDFSTMHLADSSSAGIKAPVMVSGPQVETELKFMTTTLQSPDRPFVAILGGNNIQEKFDLIPGLLDSVDEIIIGGALAFPFLDAVHNMPIGDSPTISSVAEQIPGLMAAAAVKGVTIHLPLDFLVTDSPDGVIDVTVADVEGGIPEGKMGLDIGERSRAKFAEVIVRAGTVVMDGPLGLVEDKVFQEGTNAVFDALSKVTESGATTVLAGNTTVTYAKAQREHLESPTVTHMTATAALNLLAGRTLPGLAVLEPGYKPREEPKTRRKRKRKKKKKKKKQLKDERPVMDRRARIASWLESTKGMKYALPPKSKLPPLPTFRKPVPPIKYTGAPPPGKNKSMEFAVKLFKLRPWKAPTPPPPPPKKPQVPRLASLAHTKPKGPPMRSASEMPWSHKHKIGLSGMPGPTYFRPPTIPLACIPPGPGKEKLPRVPAQIPVVAKFDKGGNLLVHVDGTQGDLPDDAQIEVTLVRGFNACLDKKPIAPRLKMTQEHPLPPKLVPWPQDYDPNAFDPDLPFPGRYPRLNTTLTQENYIRYRRIFRG